MRQAILDFPKQFIWEPQIKNSKKLVKTQNIIIAGMGGSALGAEILKMINPRLNIVVHRNYGLPQISNLKDYLLIASSYSGNTEETIDAYLTARKKKLSTAVVCTGGKLLELAQKDKIPFVQIPKTDIQPRSALGFSVKALAKITKQKDTLNKLSIFGKQLVKIGSQYFEKKGKEMAEDFKGFVPIIYSSESNRPIAYNWKIKFNETGKIPAFCNVFPELNHNEMTGFDFNLQNKALCDKFKFIFLEDSQDHLRIQKRMQVLKQILQNKGFEVISHHLETKSILHKIFYSLLTADWASYYTAILYQAEPEKVPMIEEFKAKIKND